MIVCKIGYWTEKWPEEITQWGHRSPRAVSLHPANFSERLLRHFVEELLLCLSAPADLLRHCVCGMFWQVSEIALIGVCGRQGQQQHLLRTKRIICSLHFRLIHRATSYRRMPSPWRSKWTHQLMGTRLKLWQVFYPRSAILHHSGKMVYMARGGRAGCPITKSLTVQIQSMGKTNPSLPPVGFSSTSHTLVCGELNERPL